MVELLHDAVSLGLIAGLMVPNQHIRYLFVVVPVSSLALLVTNSRYFLDAWNAVVIIRGIQPIVIALVVYQKAVVCFGS
jgi:hypothetical protein